MLYVRSDSFEIHCGDAEECLADIETGSVQTVVTSPPYFALRDYGTATWDGGDPGCAHGVPPRGSVPKNETSTISGTRKQDEGPRYREVCGICGAVRTEDLQVGIEANDEEYIGRLVSIFDGVRRTLVEDGTMWLNIGESWRDGQMTGLPWRVALALQSEGWRLLQCVIWDKTNAMPESVKSRPTDSHEYVFLLAAGARGQYRHVTASGNHERSVWRGPTAGYKGAHVAVFPLWLPQKALLLTSRAGQTVLDPFAGSGTTLVAALGYGRRAVGIDLLMENCSQQARRIEREVFAPARATNV